MYINQLDLHFVYQKHFSNVFGLDENGDWDYRWIVILYSLIEGCFECFNLLPCPIAALFK